MNVGNDNELPITTTDEIKKYSFDGLLRFRNNNPNAQISFNIQDFTHIDIYDKVVASVELTWRMNLAGAEGRHKTYFHLVKIYEIWKIVNVLDRGFEES